MSVSSGSAAVVVASICCLLVLLQRPHQPQDAVKTEGIGDWSPDAIGRKQEVLGAQSHPITIPVASHDSAFNGVGSRLLQLGSDRQLKAGTRIRDQNQEPAATKSMVQNGAIEKTGTENRAVRDVAIEQVVATKRAAATEAAAVEDVIAATEAESTATEKAIDDRFSAASNAARAKVAEGEGKHELVGPEPKFAHDATVFLQSVCRGALRLWGQTKDRLRSVGPAIIGVAVLIALLVLLFAASAFFRKRTSDGTSSMPFSSISLSISRSFSCTSNVNQ